MRARTRARDEGGGEGRRFKGRRRAERMEQREMHTVRRALRGREGTERGQ